VDHTVLVSLYERFHLALGLLASLTILGAISVGLHAIAALGDRQARAVRRGCAAIAVLAMLWVVVLGVSPALRSTHADALVRFDDEPLYVTRAMRRGRQLGAWVRGEPSDAGFGDARIADLAQRYGLSKVSRHPMWDAPFREPPNVSTRVEQMRGDDPDYNVIVYYVDTLRGDVAYDEAVMPNLARLGRQGIRFEHAYSCAPETLAVLPCLLGGHYDLRRVEDDDKGAPPKKGSFGRSTLLDLAKDRGVPTTLFIPESAYQFLSPLLPEFAFDEVLRFSDHEKAGVWGYGADGTTADEIVTRTLDWLSERQGRRFFTWIFHYDVHNWRQLDRQRVRAAAQRFDMVDDGDETFAYRVAARGVDEALGRLLDGLEQLNLDESTIILFVSDHGEGLGEGGFWVHSVFLWESLLHVPLVLRVPRLPPAVVTDRVSLVDVAPTLARYLHPAPPMEGYHGEDLLSFLVADRPPRRLPILASSTLEGKLARVGIIHGRYKLVLKADWGAPALYDLEGPLPDDEDFADRLPRETLERMNLLVSSPVFTNAHEDARAMARRER
jgi:hypothetical protein